jgi:hypothetical protein
MHVTGYVQPTIPTQNNVPSATSPGAAGDVFVVEPRYLGVGNDIIIGGPGRPQCRFIDLSRLKEPVMVHWDGADCGSITDGADTIVFQGIEDIILPDCMASQRRHMA